MRKIKLNMNCRIGKNINIFLPILMFFFGIWYFAIRILGLDFAYIPGDFGDARFIHYILEHGYRFLSGNENSFWNASFMFPYKNNIALSDNMLGTMPIYALYRIIGINSETSFQFW
ncbi:MAG: hypothetical protein M0R21_06050 [Lentimicrobiaceae bacterium]|nr:hypothetical protein [Lentimicrobiaceae bacterium]